MSLRNVVKEIISEIDWFYIIMIIIVSVLLISVGIFGLLYTGDSSKECSNRKVVHVVNVNKDHYRTIRTGKVTTTQRYEVEYVRVILDDYSTWEARYDDLDHDVVVGNTLSNSCGKIWDKK